MARHFHYKNDDNESSRGAKKHRFNAEYSDDLEVFSKKKHRANKRRDRRDSFAFDDMQLS